MNTLLLTGFPADGGSSPDRDPGLAGAGLRCWTELEDGSGFWPVRLEYRVVWSVLATVPSYDSKDVLTGAMLLGDVTATTGLCSKRRIITIQNGVVRNRRSRNISFSANNFDLGQVPRSPIRLIPD